MIILENSKITTVIMKVLEIQASGQINMIMMVLEEIAWMVSITNLSIIAKINSNKIFKIKSKNPLSNCLRKIRILNLKKIKIPCLKKIKIMLIKNNM
jgi:hypothetical protein